MWYRYCVLEKKLIWSQEICVFPHINFAILSGCNLISTMEKSQQDTFKSFILNILNITKALKAEIV